MFHPFRFSIVLVSLVVFFCLSGGVKVGAEASNTSNGLASSKLSVASSLIGPQSVNEACAGVDLSSTGSCPDTTTNLNNILSTVISILSIVVGIIAVIMIIIGGLKFITSGGEASKSAGARNTIIYALIGLVVAVLAQVLVHFVLNRVVNAANTKSPASSSTSACVNSPSCLPN
ncbi:MAG TPA: hypothetical protein VMR95_03750 [Candidatus Binatia bacterium]|nr:hypothetical protein [Candidatus Binatia bacterium]